MNSRVFLAIFFAAAVFDLPLCRADEIVPTSHIQPLVEWVETRTNLMLLPRPHIFVSDEALANLTRGSSSEKGRDRIAAYHDGVIVVSAKYWQPGDIADQSVLVHELVHYAQEVGEHKAYACPSQREAEAYRLQNAYLVEQGERPMLDSGELERLNQCD